MKVLILASGGYDSVTLMHLAHSLRMHTELLFVDYGQCSVEAEKNALSRTCELLNIPKERVHYTTISLPWATANVMGNHDNKVAYVESRNAIFASLALSLGESLKVDKIWIGVTHDSPDYPDCTEEFIYNMNTMAMNLNGITIEAPLGDMTKYYTVLLGNKLGVTFYNSCSNPSPTEFNPCNECVKCIDMIKALNIIKSNSKISSGGI